MAVRNQQIWPYGWYANSLNNAKRAPSVQSDWAAGIQPSSVDAKFTGSPFLSCLRSRKALQTGSFQNKWRREALRIWEDRRFMHEVWHWF
jgi:hypothetical protein